MAIHWTIDSRAGLVRLKYTGDPDISVWKQVMEEIFEHPDYRPGFGFVADLSESNFPDTAHLNAVQQFLETHKDQVAGSRWANVTRDPVHYGMSRMAKVFIEDLPTRLEIFDNLEAAENWARSKDKG